MPERQPEWGSSEWLDVCAKSSDEEGGRDVDWRIICTKTVDEGVGWMGLLGEWTKKVKDPLLRKARAQKQSEGVGPAKVPKNPCTKKCSN